MTERRRWPFNGMEIGDTVIVNVDFYNSTKGEVSTAAHNYGLMTGKHFITEFTGENQVEVKRVTQDEKITHTKTPKQGKLSKALDSLDVGESHYVLITPSGVKPASVAQSARRLSNKTGKKFKLDMINNTLAVTRVK